VLGGDVKSSAHIEGNTAGSCRFVSRLADQARAIEVLVGPSDTHPCPPNSTPLKALGNEAVQCQVAKPVGARDEIISGRIRNIYFVIVLTNVPDATRSEPTDPHLADEFGASPLEQVAEQVVGNLY
jgi:hypothetical protein